MEDGALTEPLLPGPQACPNPVSLLVWGILHALSILVPYTCPSVFWSLLTRPGLFAAGRLILHLAWLSWAYLRVAHADPGFLTPQQASRLARLRASDLEGLFSVCPVCGVRPLRARHCRDCGRCVCSADHHCGFLGVCVGEGNHLAFLGYLWVEAGYLVHVVVGAGRAVFPRPLEMTWTDFIADNIQYFVSCLVIAGFLLFVVFLGASHAVLLLTNRSTREYVRDVDWAYLLVPPPVVRGWEEDGAAMQQGETGCERAVADGSRAPRGAGSSEPRAVPARWRTWEDLRRMEAAWNTGRGLLSLRPPAEAGGEFLPALWVADTSGARAPACCSQYKVCDNEVYSCCD